MQHDIKAISDLFQIDGEFLDARPYGSGHINDTYASAFRTPAGDVRYIHQRINHTIFTQPEQLMDNIRRVTEHLRGKVLQRGGEPLRETLTLIPAHDERCFARDGEGNYWRTYVFIEGAQTYDLVEKDEHVYHAAKAFGNFQRDLADLPGGRLHEIIPGFHDTSKRFDAFRDALDKDVAGRAESAREEIDFALQREDTASVLVDLLAEGKVPERTTHNDTKFNNVMIDDATGRGICVIDLDTVMPGLAMYDFGDSVRLGAATALEDEQDLDKVGVNFDRFELLAKGYLEAARDFLTPLEAGHLAFAARLITFTIGLRFITDHLAGDTYFKVHRENHNLDRCRTQFKMVRMMEDRYDEMKNTVQRYA